MLGPIGVEVEGRRSDLGTKMVAALFALLVTSSELTCDRGEIAAVLWPEESDAKVLKGRVEWVVGELRKLLGSQFLPHAGRSKRCVLRLPLESVDYLRFLERRRQAEGLPSMERIDLLRAALDEWADDEPLKGLEMPGFKLRRERMWRERADTVCELLDAAWKAREEKFLREESEKWHVLFPGDPKIFAYYLIAHDPKRPDENLERTVARWLDRNNSSDDFLFSVIERLYGRTPRVGRSGLLSVPDQLPPEKRFPVGRGKLLDELTGLVDEAQAAGQLLIILLSGMAGVGKSTLALHLAHRLRERFSGGTLYGELNGHTDGASPTDPEQLLDGFLAALPPYSTVTDIDRKTAELRSVLAHRSTLLFLDNALNSKQVDPLLPGTGSSVVIVTSRNELESLSSCGGRVYSRRVELLRDEDALEVLQENVAEGDRSKHSFLFRELVGLCGNLPLALSIVARRLRYHGVYALPTLVRQMKEEKKKLEYLDLPEAEWSIRVALNCSVRDLSAEARLLLWQLAVHPGPNLSLEALMDIGSAVAGLCTDQALWELMRANLVERQSDRYRLHDLVRTFARHHLELDASEDLEGLEEATLRQVLEHQLQNVWACDRVLDSQRELPIGEVDGVTVIDPEGPKQVMDRMDKEYNTTQRCLELANHRMKDRYSWLLPMALVTYQWRRHRLQDSDTGLSHAAKVVERMKVAHVDRAMVYRMRAGTQWRLGNYDLAANNLARAVRLSKQDDSESGRLSLARSLYALGITRRKLDDATAAEEHLKQALELYRELREPVGEAAALNAIGALHLDGGEYGEALHWCAGALQVVERTVDHSGRADVLFTLAKVRLARTEREEAIPLYEQACGIYQSQECWTDEDKTRRLFAGVLVSAGRIPEAVEELERVLVLREQMEADTKEVRDILETLR
ncbi:tetratricopeptide repeat protein [Streptomyces sp. NPDC059247]|uniref:AfsR/SARP family transcriptional regulator n=1 Tax=Streptomyces sp. NPDC059247 TaxID=3346790 RepID=UPI003693613C